MERDVTTIENGDSVHAAPMTSNEEVESKQELNADHSRKGAVNEEFQDNKEVSTAEITNIEADQTAMTEASKPTENELSVDPSPGTDASESIETSPLKAQSQEVSTDKIDSGIGNASEVEIESTSNSPRPKNDLPPGDDKIDSGISNASEVEIESTSNSPRPKKNDLPPVEEKTDSGSSNASEVEIERPKKNDLSPGNEKIDSGFSTASEVEIKRPKKNDLPPVNEKTDSGFSTDSEVEIESTSNNPMRKKNDLPPVVAKTKQVHSPLMSRKSSTSDTDEDHHNEADNRSVASSHPHSAGSSVRSSKFKITVPVAPKFVSGERVARRKELNKMREEKQKASEAERRDYEARRKEEEQGEIKQLRKSMSYKANPVPKFYQEGPPPKTKLKKLPLTRPKSPNLSRRKSCSDSFMSARDEKRGLW